MSDRSTDTTSVRPAESAAESAGGEPALGPPHGGGPVSGFGAPALPGQHYVLAGWWRRVGAQLVDGLIVGIGGVLLLIAITAPFSIGFFASGDAGLASIAVGAIIALVCVAIIALVYAPALMARTNGKTLGRMATGIRVVRASGEPIDFGFAMLREVAVKTLGFGVAGSITGGIANLLDALWPLWDEQNRALHDFVVDTRTVLDE
jgi:uncharacterized RDD family membrane protein YckC